MPNTIKIMVIEDHPEFRETLEFVINKELDMELLGQYGNAELGLRALESMQTQVSPDILLLDLHLPGMSGLDAIQWIETYAPKTKIIVLTQSDKEKEVLHAIHLGASGYLLKSSTMQLLTKGIRDTFDGHAIVDPSVARYLLNNIRSLPLSSDNAPLLSKRETEVLSFMAEGLAQKEIAKKMEISTYTVTDHLKHIYEKLNVQNAPQAVAQAFKKGILRE